MTCKVPARAEPTTGIVKNTACKSTTVLHYAGFILAQSGVGQLDKLLENTFN